jgi:outer membrane protein assembly factor BamC
MKLTPTLVSLSLLTAGLLGGCGSMQTDDWLPDNRVDYRKEKAADQNLEVPPDLTKRSIKDRSMVPELGGVSVSYTELDADARGATTAASTRGEVLPTIAGVELMREGQDRWLVIQADADTVWNRVLDFWQGSGVLLAEQDPMAGVMRTSWLENRADIGQDFITDTIRSVFDGLYDAGTRDQYRVRLERVGPKTTELYLTHFGAQEEIVTGSTGETDQAVWNFRPRDPQLEAEMLRRLMVHLGIEARRAEAKLAAGEREREARSQLIAGEGGSALSINEGFARAWRLTGLALDRVGFAVQDRNRDAGVYYVRYADPGTGQQEEEGWLSSLAFWRSDDAPVSSEEVYQVRVEGRDAGVSLVTVHDEQGQRLNNEVAKRILTLMQGQLR